MAENKANGNTTTAPPIRSVVDCVSRDHLRQIVVGQTIEFVIADNVPVDEVIGKLESARAACNQMKMRGLRFSCHFGKDGRSAIITRLQ